MVEDRRRRRTLASLLALVGAVALVAAGCGGKSADQKANEAYANSVCSAIADWETQVKSIATDLSAGISESSLQSKVTQVESETKGLVTDIKAVPPPNTSDGQAAKQQLDQLSTDLTTTVTSTKTTVAGLQGYASVSSVAAAVATVAPQVKSLTTTAQSTISRLQSAKGSLSDAFQSTDSCKSLGSSG